MALHAPRCYACKGPKPDGYYLCGGCWPQLTQHARRQLTKKDRSAGARLRELARQIFHGVPLSDVVITEWP
jgi:hypothetical protein